MSELPPGWVLTRLSDVAEVRLGRQRSPDRATGEHMRPYLRAANVTWAGINLSDVKEMDFSPREYIIYSLRPGDVLLAEASGSPEEVGKPALWQGEIAECCFQNTLIRVRSSWPLPKYLYYHFLADARLGRFAGAGKGIGINHLGADRMSSWPVRLAPIEEQRRLVAKLDTVQARSRRAREALDEVPGLLEKLRQSILAAAFRGDLTKDWRAKNPDVEPASKLLQRIRAERRKKWEESELARLLAKGKPPTDDRWKAQYSEPLSADTERLSELPTEWCWASMEEICDAHRVIAYGIIKAGPHFPGGVPYVRVTEVATGVLDIRNLPCCDPERAAKFPRSTLKTGDILVSKDGTIGKVAVVPPALEGANINQHVLRVAPIGLMNGLFLARMIESPHSQGWMHGEVKGIALRGVNVEDFRRMPVPLAPIAEQQVAVERVNRAFSRIASLRRIFSDSDTMLSELGRAVISKAFRGELVPQDPADEPAAAMLARLGSAAAPSTDSSPSPPPGKRRARPRKS